MSSTSNNVTWFEIGTDDVATARDFYGAVFGWTFETGPGASSYSMISTPGGEGSPQGGLADTGGRAPNYAVFYIQVDDVPATLAAAEARSAKVVVPAQTTPDGLVFAQVLDPAGNQIGIFTPPGPGAQQ